MRKKEIGSFFEIEECHSDCIKVNQNYDILLNSGREAILYAIKDIESKKKFDSKVCLLPIYTCDTVIKPFIDCGWDICFYYLKKDLSVKREQLERIIAIKKPALMLAHPYYGCDTLKSARDIIKKARQDGMIYIEDMTQSLGLYNKNANADYYVCSLRKWISMPDGAFVSSHVSQLNERYMREKEKYVKLKYQAQLMKKKYLEGDINIDKKRFLKMNGDAEEYLNEDMSICKMSEISLRFFAEIDINYILKKRSYNGGLLYKYIKQLKNIKPVVEHDSSISYLYFPVYTDYRDELQEYLKANNIYAPILWPISDSIYCLDENAKYIYDHLLAIPCDQRYGKEDMDRICSALLNFEKLKEECNDIFQS